jgi:phosphoribosylanthranilate isomerase
VRRLWIKICGMRAVVDVEAAAAAGADALGFVFHEPSPRHLSMDDARKLQAAVPPGVARVAVFLHPSQAQVDAVVEAIRPDWLQADLEALGHLVLPPGPRVLPVLRKDGAKIGSEPFSADAAGRHRVGSRENGSEPIFPQPILRVLLEGATSGQGERADWAQARALAARCELVLAGGLDAGNLGEAIRAVRPFGVDVSSGVERARGVKDPARIREFIRAARAAEQGLA